MEAEDKSWFKIRTLDHTSIILLLDTYSVLYTLPIKCRIRVKSWFTST